METVNLNSLKSFIGKNVNLHLKDGSVIINVRLENLTRDELNGKLILRCVPFRKNKPLQIPVKKVAWAENLNPFLLPLYGGN
ncbi:hypothetical protein DRO50_04640 [Candidatus Bathyarchaeota archaeon]|nr:MAG: hypothetical protein DRO50_04640 [Candidatus Bathyarchaeota archaeon]